MFHSGCHASWIQQTWLPGLYLTGSADVHVMMYSESALAAGSEAAWHARQALAESFGAAACTADGRQGLCAVQGTGPGPDEPTRHHTEGEAFDWQGHGLSMRFLCCLTIGSAVPKPCFD